MQIFLPAILFLISYGALAKPIFLAERGNYSLTMDDIVETYSDRGVSWVTLDPSKVIPGARYKILPNQNEFRMKNWYQQDWYALQDLFVLDSLAFMKANQGSTFNEAKRNQYSTFPFDVKKSFHRKTIPSMSEWGGLTHPPVKKLVMPLEEYHSRYAPMDYKKISSAYFDSKLQREIDEVSDSELTFGNEVKVLADADSFQAKLRLIRKAKKSIFMSSLAFACDKSATELVELLIKKHQEGVDVRVITDGTISKVLSYSECPQMMKAAGVQIIRTKDILKYKKKSIYHSKMLVTDLSEAISGGHNMLDADNLSKGVDFKNRDLDLYVKGAMATDMALMFVENWNYHYELQRRPLRLSSLDEDLASLKNLRVSERKAGLRGESLYEKVLSKPATRMDGVCRFIKQNPYQDSGTITKAYLKLMDKVENYLAITDPIKSDTFVSSRKQLGLTEKWDTFENFNLLHTKVQDYLKSGKRLDYITTSMNMAGNENVAIMNEAIASDLDAGRPMKANWHLGILLFSNRFYGKAHFKNLLADYVPFENAHVWTHMSFMHSKVFYFDRIVASIGSLNFHHNATDHAYESTAICMDEQLNRDMDQILVQDMANSMPLIFSK